MEQPSGRTSALEAHNTTSIRARTGYMPIEEYGLIGNMRTCALVAIDGGLDFMCWPAFDSPSVFCRMLDKDKGGHFSIYPQCGSRGTTKQQYLPSSNILQTRFIGEEGVMNVVDFFPRPNKPSGILSLSESNRSILDRASLKRWLVRRVECIRDEIEVNVEVFPAFNYAQDEHTTEVLVLPSVEVKGESRQRIVFRSEGLSLELHATIDCGEEDQDCPVVRFQEEARSGMLGEGVTASFLLKEGQAVSFVLREHEDRSPEHISTALLNQVQRDTHKYWSSWITKSKYRGRWEEVVTRSLFILKLLTYEPTGAIVAAPTFSLPEDFGGSRNWDYRFSWVRDSSFTIYILLRMGFTEEADAYTNFIFERIKHTRTPEGDLPIMFTIRGETDIPEVELIHLSGYRDSKPVRIGNGAAFHIQLDIYGELMDGLYLANKFGKPTTYDQWLQIRQITDRVCEIWQEKDMSIWEVRGEKQNFVYSKIMLWVAINRALRLADKRSFPCPRRWEWLKTMDTIYEDIMEKGYNQNMQAFIQSYEQNEVLDSSVLIAPLVFFIAPNDPRFLNTLNKILLPPEKGGLTSTGLVYRYNWSKSNDGVGGREGAFSMCTFWLVEALTRAGAYDKRYLEQAVSYFENVMGFGNHLHMFSEEISKSGEQLGNTPQAFSHLGLISAAFNLERVTRGTST